MDGAAPKDVTTLLIEWSGGSPKAFNELTPLVYDELHALAERALRRERPGHTLQATALVHEAYLKLVDQRRVRWNDREHFFAIASQTIRRVLVNHARSRNSLKRGGGITLVAFEEESTPQAAREIDLAALDDALTRLSKLDPQQERIVELRYFGGFSIESTARVLGISRSAVSREWDLARAWLQRDLTRGTASGT